MLFGVELNALFQIERHLARFADVEVDIREVVQHIVVPGVQSEGILARKERQLLEIDVVGVHRLVIL